MVRSYNGEVKQMAKKTVYILGAGASASANIPTQSGLLPLVFSINYSSFSEMSVENDFLSLDINNKQQRIQEFYPKFDLFRQQLGKFIVTNFSTTDKLSQYNVALQYAKEIVEIDTVALQRKESFLFKAYDIAKTVNVSLEDLFTVFDSVNSGREHFRLYSPKEMAKIHNQLKLCIIYSLSFAIATRCNIAEYKYFSEYLIKQRKATSQKEDSLAVITMNWDDVLESTLYKLCVEYNNKLTNNQIRIHPDLCFYNYDLANDKKHLPSTHIKAKGHKNIKVLKMHGSLAWLECPKCGRIYTDFANEIASEEFSDLECSYCKELDSIPGGNPILRSLIITPTFLKSLDNLNVKNIWHNAFIDVSEADNIVFIGYSFPDADFEMRCLLKKSTKNNVSVHVVLSEADNPKKYISDFISNGFDERAAFELVSRMCLPEERYKSFFGEDRVAFHYNGFGNYIDEIGGDANE